MKAVFDLSRAYPAPAQPSGPIPLVRHGAAPDGAQWRRRNTDGLSLYVALKGGLRIESAFGDIEAPASYAACVPRGAEHNCSVTESGGQFIFFNLPAMKNFGSAHPTRAPRRLEDSHSYYLISTLISRTIQNAGGLAHAHIECLSKHVSGEDAPTRDDWFARIIDRISLSMQAPPSLDELADEAGMHPITLTKKFRRQHGCSIGEFRQRVRAERAFYRIIKQAAPLSEISLACGYADQSHMTREFRRFFSLTPAFLRRATTI